MNKIILCLLAVPLFSCSLLDEVAYNSFSEKEYYKNEQQVKYALFDVYQTLDGITFYNQLIGNVGTDESRCWLGLMDDRVFDTYGYNSSTPNLQYLWTNLYSGINKANAVIEGVKGSSLSEETKNLYIAEARFLRGLYYYWLVRLWGEVPYRTEKSDSYESALAESASVEDIYGLIISDFTAAKILPETYSSEVGRATCGAANAYLASAYLSMTGFPLYQEKHYADVIEACQAVIDLKEKGVYELLPVYSDVFASENNKESIFEYQAGSQVGTGNRVKSLMGVVGVWPVTYQQTDPTKQYPDLRVGMASIRPVWSFVDSFIDGDLRKSYSISEYRLQGYDENGYTTTDATKVVTVKEVANGSNRKDTGISKFRFPEGTDVSNFAYWDNPLNFTLMRYAEVLLMMAEAQYKVNGYEACKTYLEPLATRAGVSVWDGSGDFTERILSERGWELCFEGKRWFDLQRFGKLYEKVSMRDAGYSIDYAEFFKANITPEQLYYPIPQKEIDYNPNL